MAQLKNKTKSLFKLLWAKINYFAILSGQSDLSFTTDKMSITLDAMDFVASPLGFSAIYFL